MIDLGRAWPIATKKESQILGLLFKRAVSRRLLDQESEKSQAHWKNAAEL